jgi:hypothetical protein
MATNRAITKLLDAIGLVPWSLTFMAKASDYRTSGCHRACPVESHVHGYKENDYKTPGCHRACPVESHVWRLPLTSNR